jgi:hypothetical protein
MNTDNKVGYKSTEDFILDKKFSLWVLNPDDELDTYWGLFLAAHPEKEDQIRDAVRIIKAFQPVEPAIPEYRLNKILEKVLLLNQQRFLGRYHQLRHAAVWALVIGVAGLIMLSVPTKDKFPLTADNTTIQKGKVILSNGVTHEFNSEQSVITHSSSGHLTINNDTVNLSGDPNNSLKSSMNQIIIPFGQRSEVTLEDGTHIWLNSGSRLSYPSEFKDDSREVYLIGEAFFEVTTDARKPFFVNTPDFKIKVLGTKFNVCSYNDDPTVQTVLLEGKVSAGKNSLFAGMVDMVPGERLVYEKTENKLVSDKVDVQLYTSWINGYLVFKNEPTTEVFKKLERHYNQIIKTDPGLEKITFSGKLDLKDHLKEVLENISFASSVRVIEENGTLLIKQ